MGHLEGRGQRGRRVEAVEKEQHMNRNDTIVPNFVPWQRLPNSVRSPLGSFSTPLTFSTPSTYFLSGKSLRAVVLVSVGVSVKVPAAATCPLFFSSNFHAALTRPNGAFSCSRFSTLMVIVPKALSISTSPVAPGHSSFPSLPSIS